VTRLRGETEEVTIAGLIAGETKLQTIMVHDDIVRSIAGHLAPLCCWPYADNIRMGEYGTDNKNPI
jgi:hypothetical protein